LAPVFISDAAKAIPLLLYTRAGFAALDADAFPNQRAIASAQGFKANVDQLIIVPGPDGATAHVMAGLGSGDDALALAGIAARLPSADYRLTQIPEGQVAENLCAAWADGAYRFERYRKPKAEARAPRLVLPTGVDGHAVSREALATARLRDLVNTPAQDMNPAGLQAALSELAERFGASLRATIGEALLAANYPMVHAVGRAAASEPRFVELHWGNPKHPKVALVGKGVTFDSGGLDIKPSDGMRIMKKDMGGAAHVIALAELIMGANLPVHLSVYVPAVENAISGNAFRPGDIISTRKGLTVEIDNTDAEGRLILCDALTRACEDEPDVLIDFATLTGAARVALGPDLAPLYTDDDALAADILLGSKLSGDPVWRMPLWAPYFSDLNSPIADLANSGGKFAGSITAALFLKEFVTVKHWAHFDIWAWRLAKYGRPAGGAACGLRAVWSMLQKRYPA
jgi:leucyl aminopeptidase